MKVNGKYVRERAGNYESALELMVKDEICPTDMIFFTLEVAMKNNLVKEASIHEN